VADFEDSECPLKWSQRILGEVNSVNIGHPPKSRNLGLCIYALDVVRKYVAVVVPVSRYPPQSG